MQALSDDLGLFRAEVVNPGFTTPAPPSWGRAKPRERCYAYRPVSHRAAFSEGMGVTNRKVLSNKQIIRHWGSLVAWVEFGQAERRGFWASTGRYGDSVRMRERCSPSPFPSPHHPLRGTQAWKGKGRCVSIPTCSLGRWDVSQGPGSGNSLDPLRKNRAAQFAEGRLWGQERGTCGPSVALNAKAGRKALVLPGGLNQRGPECGRGEASYSQGKPGTGRGMNQDPEDPTTAGQNVLATQLAGRQP